MIIAVLSRKMCDSYETMNFIFDSEMVKSVSELTLGGVINVIVVAATIFLGCGFLILCARVKTVLDYIERITKK